MMRLRLMLLALIGLPLLSQEVQDVHLRPEHARQLRAIWDRKAKADKDWALAQQWVLDHYISTPGVATSGAASVPVRSLPTAWQYGIRFTSDFEVITPKPKPPEPKSGCEPETDSQPPGMTGG